MIFFFCPLTGTSVPISPSVSTPQYNSKFTLLATELRFFGLVKVKEFQEMRRGNITRFDFYKLAYDVDKDGNYIMKDGKKFLNHILVSRIYITDGIVTVSDEVDPSMQKIWMENTGNCNLQQHKRLPEIESALLVLAKYIAETNNWSEKYKANLYSKKLTKMPFKLWRKLFLARKRELDIDQEQSQEHAEKRLRI